MKLFIRGKNIIVKYNINHDIITRIKYQIKDMKFGLELRAAVRKDAHVFHKGGSIENEHTIQFLYKDCTEKKDIISPAQEPLMRLDQNSDNGMLRTFQSKLS